jgi:mRNA-degrading endonuclease toxin of MazEF toxin-antitoxin module
VSTGDVCWVDLPLRGGRAQAGRRPGIVLQSGAVLPTTLIVPLTSQLDALRFQGTVLIEPDASNGLRVPSVALVFQFTALDNRFIAGKIGRISEEIKEEIFSALDGLIGRL